MMCIVNGNYRLLIESKTVPLLMMSSPTHIYQLFLFTNPTFNTVQCTKQTFKLCSTPYSGLAAVKSGCTIYYPWKELIYFMYCSVLYYIVYMLIYIYIQMVLAAYKSA